MIADLPDELLDESSDPAEVADALTTLSAGLEPVEPPPGLRQAVLAAAEHRGRFQRFTAKVAELLVLGEERAGELLDAIGDPTSWESGPLPGVTLFHVEGGPGTEQAVTGFVRVQAGGAFPMHRHLGDEVTLILQGCCLDEDGTLYTPGDEVRFEPETSHSFSVPDGGPDLLYLVVVQQGVEIGGEVIGPGDPRA